MGCATVISPESLQQVDQNVNFEQILENPDAYRGRIVLLGGDIIETKNLPEKTEIIVSQRSLDYRKKPNAGSTSKGRFILSVPRFLDPAIYKPWRKLTVAGEVAGKEVRPLGDREYTYPVITEKELYLWPSEEYHPMGPSLHFGIGVGLGF